MADAGVVVGLLGKGLQPERRREVALEGLYAFDAAALERAHAVHAGRVLGRGRMSGGDVLHGLGVRLHPLEHLFVGARARVAGAAAALGQLARPFVGGVGGGFLGAPWQVEQASA